MIPTLQLGHPRSYLKRQVSVSVQQSHSDEALVAPTHVVLAVEAEQNVYDKIECSTCSTRSAM